MQLLSSSQNFCIVLEYHSLQCLQSQKILKTKGFFVPVAKKGMIKQIYCLLTCQKRGDAHDESIRIEFEKQRSKNVDISRFNGQ